MKTLSQFIESIPSWGWWALGGVLLAGLIINHWSYLSFTRTRLWWSLPFGPMRFYGRNPQQIPGSNWTLGEQLLCGAFFGFYPEPLQLEAMWDTASSYLDKAGELGRKPFPFWGWLGLTALLVIESASLGLILTDFVATQLPSLYRMWVGYSLGAVIGAVLLVLTHAAGKERRHAQLLNRARHWFQCRPAAEENIPLRPAPGVTLNTNGVDDHLPAYVHILSRLDHAGDCRPSYWLSITALVFVIAVGWTAFSMRESLYDKFLSMQAGEAAVATAANDDASILLGEPSLNDAHTQAADRAAAHAAYICLIFVYGALQVCGLLAGWAFGFCSKEGAAAARIRGEFNSKDEFLAWNRSRLGFVANVAGSLLLKLQHRILEHATGNAGKDIHTRTFIAFCRARWAERDGYSPVPPAPDAGALNGAGNGTHDAGPNLRLINP
jgi:hypothetical protein